MNALFALAVTHTRPPHSHTLTARRNPCAVNVTPSAATGMVLCGDLLSTKPAPECANLTFGDGEWHPVGCTVLDDVTGELKTGVCDVTGLCYRKWTHVDNSAKVRAHSSESADGAGRSPSLPHKLFFTLAPLTHPTTPSLPHAQYENIFQSLPVYPILSFQYLNNKQVCAHNMLYVHFVCPTVFIDLCCTRRLRTVRGPSSLPPACF